MHTTPSPDPAATAHAGPDPVAVPAPATPSDAPGEFVPHTDPYAEAQAAAVENLLRCWARETDAHAPADGVLAVPCRPAAPP